MKRFLAIIGLMMIAGVAIFGLRGTGERPAAVGVTEQPEAATSLAPVRTAPVSRDESAPPGTLRYLRLALETGGDTAEACLVFSAPLKADGSVRYEDYVAIKSDFRAGFRIDGKRLCLSGFPFGEDYNATLKAGLPGAAGETLAEPRQVVVGFGDRPSSVSLGSGFILPREVAEGLPVTTVNVSTVDLVIYRIGDRLLARMRADMVDERYVASYEMRDIARDEGRLVWSGTMPVEGPRNEAVVSLFPLSKSIGTPEPGAYLVVASKHDPLDKKDGYGERSSQWVVQSDLGLTSLTGGDGLTLVARSLATAKPVEGVRLVLVARNNDELAEAVTDADGIARFAQGLMRGTGGMAPVMVMAHAGTDFNFLDLRRPDFDLSDRGVEGRPPPGPVDAFLYTDRGIYRPGETVQLVALARDAQANALPDTRLVVKVTKPNGKEYRRFTLAGQAAGAAHLTLALPVAAGRGKWEATAHVDPEGEAVGRAGFDVQDFVPQKLALDIGERPEVLRPGDAFGIPIGARFLYGAVASSLGGEASLAVEPDPAPFPRHQGFRWGVEGESVTGRRDELAMADTDDKGRTLVKGVVPRDLKSSRPLRATVSIAVREPGGRATSDRFHIPVRTDEIALGIRPHFDGNVGDGKDAVFDVIAVNVAGELVDRRDVDYRLVQEKSSWQWYRSGSNWRYERASRDVELTSGTLLINAGQPARISHKAGWGSFRLEVHDRSSGVRTTMAFHGGWYGEASAERPDRLKIAADRQGYDAGETARLRIESEYAGEVLLVIANEKVHEVRNLSIPAGGGEIAVKMQEQWGAGAYALVTLYRPLSGKLGHAPVRAVGTAWLGLDPARRSLAVTIDSPASISPRTRIEVPVTVSGGGSGEAFVTLAAVDQGILQLTRFKSPAPQDHYLSKRRLGVGMRDDYGRLIRGISSQADGQGGDSFGGNGLDVVPTRTVALFSGLVPVNGGGDGGGRAVIPLDIPDFQGELRLMAVAFDKEKVGSAETRMIVRDPVVAELILPRFLAPGDQSRATVLLHNVEGDEGDYRVSVKAQDGIGGGMETRTIALAGGQREVFIVPLDATEAGIGSIVLKVEGPGDFSVTRLWPIQVRPPQLPVTREMVEAMPPGSETMLKAELLKDFLPGTGAVAVSLSRWQGMDVPGLLRWLDRYPHGCLEQTTSRALPLLYFNDVALLAGKAQDRDIDGRVQEAVERVLSMQGSEGGFKMWGPWGEDADPWLSVFAMDFLMRAAEKGHDVPQAPLALGRQWLKAEAIGDDRNDVRAYAWSLLARSGDGNASDLRYFHESRLPKSPMALAHLAAALDAVGERARGAAVFELAHDRVTGAKPAPQTSQYGSPLRDLFGVGAIMAQSGRSALLPALLTEAPVMDTRADHTTTQEKAWMLMAAAEMARNSGRMAVEVNGKPVGSGDPVSLAVSPIELKAGLTLRNRGEGDVFRVVSVEGVPAAPMPAEASGLTLSKRFQAMDGGAADLTNIRSNDRLVVVIEGTAEAKAKGDYAILDLLPAGWEIEGVLEGGEAGFGWLPPLSGTVLSEKRDDRFVAAMSLPTSRYVTREDLPRGGRWEEDWDFRVAYVVRAVTPGTFTLPAAVGEHMYLPKVKARTGMGQVVIGE